MQRIHTIVHVVNLNRAFLNLIEASNQLGESCLASTRIADQSHPTTCWNLQRDALEDGMIGCIAKENILKGNVTLQFFWTVVRTMHINHFRRLIEDLLDTFGSRYCITCHIG